MLSASLSGYWVLIQILLIWFVLNIVLYVTKIGEKLKKYGVSIEFFSLIIKTKRLNQYIEKVGVRYRKAIRIIADVGIIISLFLMALGIWFIHTNLAAFFISPKKFSPVTPLVPGITLRFESLPYFFIAVAITFISHELAHAIVASSENVKVKSFGFFIFFILFGGFIEPDEDMLRKSPLRSKARIFCAGSAANFVVYLLCFALLISMFTSCGVLIDSTLPEYPAHGVLTRGDVIIALNGTRVYCLRDLTAFMNTTKPGQTLVVTVIRQGVRLNLTLRLASSPYAPNKGFMGVILKDAISLKYFSFIPSTYVYSFYDTLRWTALVNVSIAVLNMLPIFIFDGGQLVASFLAETLRKRWSEITRNFISIYFLALLVLNVILSLKIVGVSTWLP